MKIGFTNLFLCICTGAMAFGEPGEPDASVVERWLALVETARQQRQTGAYQQAYETLKQARAVSQTAPDAIHMRAWSHQYLGSLAALTGRMTEAESLLKSAVRLWASAGEAGAVPGMQAEADLIRLYSETGRPGPAARLAARLEAESERLDPATAAANRVYRALAAAAYLNKDLERAEALSRKAIQIQRAHAATTLEEQSQAHNELGLILWKQGRKDEARQEARRALDILAAHQLTQVVEYAVALSNLAMMTAADRNDSEALAMMRRAIDLVQSTIGPGNVFLANLWFNYAEMLKRARRGGESKAARREAQAIYERTLDAQPGRHTVDMADLLREARRQ